MKDGKSGMQANDYPSVPKWKIDSSLCAYVCVRVCVRTFVSLCDAYHYLVSLLFITACSSYAPAHSVSLFSSCSTHFLPL